MEKTFADQMNVDEDVAFDRSILKSGFHKRKMLNISEKLKLIDLVQNSPKKKKDIAASFGIPVNTLSSIYANRERILQQCKSNFRNLNMKKIRASSYPDIEEALLSWYIKNHASTATGHISCLALRMKALQLAKSFGYDNFSASNGWIERFKMRHNLKAKKYKTRKNSSPIITHNGDAFLDVSKCDADINENSSERQIFNLAESNSALESISNSDFVHPEDDHNSGFIKQASQDTGSNPGVKDLKDEHNSVSIKLKPQSTEVSNGTDSDCSTSHLPSHAIPEIHLTEIDTEDQNYSSNFFHYNVDNESNHSKLSNSIHNVDEAFNIVLHFIGNCTESIGDKTVEAVKELKRFIEAEKERRKQKKITDFFKFI